MSEWHENKENPIINFRTDWMFVNRVRLTDAGNSLVVQYIFDHLYEKNYHRKGLYSFDQLYNTP